MQLDRAVEIRAVVRDVEAAGQRRAQIVEACGQQIGVGQRGIDRSLIGVDRLVQVVELMGLVVADRENRSEVCESRPFVRSVGGLHRGVVAGEATLQVLVCAAPDVRRPARFPDWT